MDFRQGHVQPILSGVVHFLAILHFTDMDFEPDLELCSPHEGLVQPVSPMVDSDTFEGETVVSGTHAVASSWLDGIFSYNSCAEVRLLVLRRTTFGCLAAGRRNHSQGLQTNLMVSVIRLAPHFAVVVEVVNNLELGRLRNSYSLKACRSCFPNSQPDLNDQVKGSELPIVRLPNNQLVDLGPRRQSVDEPNAMLKGRDY